MVSIQYERSDLGKIIRQARVSSGLIQQEMAQIMDISQPKLSKIENGMLIPDVLEWIRFVNATNYSHPVLWPVAKKKKASKKR